MWESLPYPISASALATHLAIDTGLIPFLHRTSNVMHTMNYATSAPAATAGGQQNGPVSVIRGSVATGARRDSLSLSFKSITSVKLT